jgi:hypothetical protein
MRQTVGASVNLFVHNVLRIAKHFTNYTAKVVFSSWTFMNGINSSSIPSSPSKEYDSGSLRKLKGRIYFIFICSKRAEQM